MQGNFGRAIEPRGDDGRPDTDRGVSDHVAVSPQPRTHPPRQRRIQSDWDRTWQADLPAVRVPAEQQIEIGMRCLTIDLGRMR